MKIIATLKNIALLDAFAREKETAAESSDLTLLVAVDDARKEYRQAVQEMDYIDGELAEYVIFKINAAERRFMSLLEQAKKEGILAWPDSVVFSPVDTCYCSQDGSGELDNSAEAERISHSAGCAG